MKKFWEKVKSFLARIQYNSPVILTYALICLAVLCLDIIIGDRISGNSINHWVFSIRRTSWGDPLAYLRVITYAFGHINIQHYFNNFLIILLVGPLLEERYGSLDLLIMIAVTTVVTGVVFLIFNPMGVSGLGASGIAFMLILLASVTNAEKGRIPLTFIFALVFYIGTELFSNVKSSAAYETTNISHVSHIIGGLCGAAFGFFLSRKRERK